MASVADRWHFSLQTAHYFLLCCTNATDSKLSSVLSWRSFFHHSQKSPDSLYNHMKPIPKIIWLCDQIGHRLNALKPAPRLQKELRIGRATRADLPRLNRTFNTEYLRTHSDDLEAQERGELSFLVAWIGNYPVAHAFVNWSGPRSDQIKPHYPECPEVYRLTVLKQYRSKGIGSSLLKACRDEALQRGCTQIGLGVDFDNPRAGALYERLGFTPSSVTHYVDQYQFLNEDGIVENVSKPGMWLIKTLSDLAPF